MSKQIPGTVADSGSTLFIDRTGDFLLETLSGGRIMVYKIDRGTGNLAAVQESPFDVGIANSLVFAPR